MRGSTSRVAGWWGVGWWGTGCCLTCLLLAPPAQGDVAGAPKSLGHATATGPAGTWRSKTDPAREMMVLEVLNSVVLLSPGRFAGSAVEAGDEFVGLVRLPDQLPAGQANARFQIQVIRMVRLGTDALRTCFSTGLDDRNPRCEEWRLAAEAPALTPPKAPEPDTSLPKFGDYVYVEELPEAIERVPPDYPQWARANGIQGTVMVQALVGRDGRVKDVRVVNSIPSLDEPARRAVLEWRFIPAKSKGRPVAVWVGIPVKFSLR